MDLLLHCDTISRSYAIDSRKIRALTNISLMIGQNEFVAIMGRSGSGKSTLLGILGLLDRVDSGRYRLEGQDVAKLTDNKRADLRSRRLGFVFQFPALLAHATALENVELPMIYAGRPPGDRHRRAMLALDRVGLGHRRDHRGNQLSGGEHQRVAIARAIVNDPPLILADEPTGALDSQTAGEILSLLVDLHRDGRTIVVVTHAPEVAAAAFRRIVLHDGRIIDDDFAARADRTCGLPK